MRGEKQWPYIHAVHFLSLSMVIVSLKKYTDAKYILAVVPIDEVTSDNDHFLVRWNIKH